MAGLAQAQSRDGQDFSASWQLCVTQRHTRGAATAKRPGAAREESPSAPAGTAPGGLHPPRPRGRVGGEMQMTSAGPPPDWPALLSSQ